MPLHPTLTVLPVAFGLALASVEVYRCFRPHPFAARLALFIHLALLLAALGAAASGQAEAGRVPTDPEMMPVLERHDGLATSVVFGAAGLLVFRIWKIRDPSRKIVLATAAGSVLILVGLTFTARAGGRLVFEHGVGVRRPPWDLQVPPAPVGAPEEDVSPDPTETPGS